MHWRKYTHKPTEITAAQFDGELTPGMSTYAGQRCFPRPDWADGAPVAAIQATHGWHAVLPGDYICRGDRGELYPLPADIFEDAWSLKPGSPREHISDDKIAGDVEQHVQGVVDAKGNPNA